jgi:hypothetical protein
VVPVTATGVTPAAVGKGTDGRARAREVKLAVFFTQDKLDDDGCPVRDRDSFSYIATFEPASVFAGLVEAEGIRRSAHHVRQLTILGDGAPWRSGTSPPASSPRPPRSSISTTPASTCMTSPASWSSCSATTGKNGISDPHDSGGNAIADQRPPWSCMSVPVTSPAPETT